MGEYESGLEVGCATEPVDHQTAVEEDQQEQS